jgi:transcriptional regulator with XRE-family HTH domain
MLLIAVHGRVSRQGMKPLTAADIQHWRVSHNLTQAQAARLLGVSLSGLRKWEQDERTPPAHLRLLIERLRPSDYPPDAGSGGNRPVGIDTPTSPKTRKR